MAAVSAHVNEGSPANPSAEQVRWRDPKRYAWLLGLIVPLLPFISWGLVEATGLGVVLVLRAVPRVRDLPDARPADRAGRHEPARQRDQVAGRRIATTAGAHTRSSRSSTPGSCSPAGCGPAASCRTVEDIGLALTVAMVSGIAINTAHELGHKRDSLERWLCTRRAGPKWLRALLHRAQPRPPRPRGHARGSGQRAAGGELLRVLPRTVSAACARRGSWRGCG